MSKMESLRVEIGELVKTLNKNKHFSKADKMALNEMAQEFLEGNIFGDEFDEFQESQRKMEKGVPIYSVFFDSETMKSMPKSLLRKALFEGEE